MPIVEQNTQTPLNEFMERLDYSKRYRVKYELGWFSTQMFVEQNAFYVQQNGELKERRPKKGYRTIAKARKMLRSIKNAVTKEEPRRQPKSFALEDEHTDEDRYVASKFLQKIYRDRNVKELVKDLMHNSLMKSNGYRQIYRDGKSVAIQDIDTFDLYIDPHGFLMWPRFQGRWMIKAIPTPVDVANKKRPGNSFVADNKIAESPQKITIKNNEETVQKSSKFGTIMVYEIYLKQAPEVKGGSEWNLDIINPTKPETTPYIADIISSVSTTEPVIDEATSTTVEQIRKVIYINNKIIEDERLDETEYPIICYQPERFAGKIYPVAWMDPIIELNKSINRIYTSLEDRVYTFSKGRYMAKRNENISNISDDNGQIIYYDNIPPQYMQQWSPWEVPFMILSLSEQYSDDAWGIHAESTGSTSGANIRSSSQIMQMQAGDIQNMSEPLDNLKSFLSVAGEMILKLASKHMVEVQKMYIGTKVINVQWSEAFKEIDKLSKQATGQLETKRIMPFTNLVVDIIPGTAYTDIQARQDLVMLRELGIMIPDEIFLDTFKVWDTQEILLKMKLEEAKNSNPDIDMATAENKKMLMWQEVMADITDDTRVHKAIHAKFLQANANNMELAQRIIAHIKQHESFERPAPTENPMVTAWAEAQTTPQTEQPATQEQQITQ